MPYVDTQHIHNLSLHYWHITESSAELLAECIRLGLSTECEAKAESRRQEILAERLLLHKIGGQPLALTHNDDRAPIVDSLPKSLSIAHTRGLLCIATAESQPIGIDLERYRPQVLKVRQGFLTTEELNFIPSNDVHSNMVAWMAKEAIFKAISVRNRIPHYAEQIRLHPFHYSPGQDFTHHGEFVDAQGTTPFLIHTIHYGDYMLSIAIAETQDIIHHQNISQL